MMKQQTQQGIPLIGPILNRIIGTRNERFVRKYTTRVEAINALEPRIRAMSDADLRAKIGEFRERLKKGETADDLMTEAFAVAREAMDRSVGIRNIFNPALSFDPTPLASNVREMYERVRTEMEARPPAPPVGEFLGSPDAAPGWRQVDIPNEIYEAVRELYPESRPPFRARPFDVQLIGAMVLYQGKIAEMKTGEGKTIVAPLATYLACIEKMKVHVVTVNDYLVQRDRDWTAPFFRALGLTVGAIHPMHMQPEDVKRQMYRCDVVYGTTSEFGFDYLRDNMKRSVTQQVQRRREFAIVDEVDSILIDEARTPLIISGPAHDDQPRYDLADQIARHLVGKQGPWNQANEIVTDCKKKIKGLEGDIRNTRDKDKVPAMQEELRALKAQLPQLEAARDQHTQFYEVKEDRKQAHLTHDGVAEAQRKAGLGSIYVDENMDLPHLIEQSLRAHAVYERDRDYIVMNLPDQMSGRTEPSIVIVDTFTGRPMIGRQWSDGLHQAIECKERVPIKQETQTVATITIQNFFKMYKRLAGMTGTADTEAQEFHDIYKLDVVSIPTNKPVIRKDYEDLMFLVAKDKWAAIVDEIKAFSDAGRPILVGTTSVEKSEMLSKMLMSKYGIQHEVLNAKQHEREAHIVENAGQLGAVMIATNMAGRGTDIKLGRCTREALLEHWLKRGIASRGLTVEASERELRENIYRKIAPQELKDDGIKKRDSDQMPFEELELKLLRAWAIKSTWISPKSIEKMSADDLREALDATGRCLLHRIRWFETIEEMGGLHVMGTERHESRRIDNQLRGRCGRQGDKGSSRFFVSLEDDLMRMFAGETQMKVLSRLGFKEGDAIEHPWLSKNIERAQRKVEERNFQWRKHILEYDEAMEHQRQTFYGLRQRVLEGRDVKGLIFEYIEESVENAVDEYLDKEYPAQCAAEFAKSRLDTSIQPERLRGKNRDEIEVAVRKDATDDARQMISVTLGEFMPLEGSEVAVDFDSAGLIQWAKSRFGVELNAADLRTGGAEERRRVQQMLEEAAVAHIERADLTGIEDFLTPDYGVKRLCAWAKDKFSIDIDAGEIARAMKDEPDAPRERILDRVRELYLKREMEYPVDFAIGMTRAAMAQSPDQAREQLAAWAKRRYDLNWTADTIRTLSPQKIRQQLIEASQAFVNSGRLDEEITAALACRDDDELAAHLDNRFNLGPALPEWMRDLKGVEREQAVRGRVESIMRGELLHFEQTVLLETLDTTWKDHLYSMEKLKDSISFRAFSQRDPRIEYKREGANMFKDMLQSVRDRVTDYIFKASLTPQVPQPQARPVAPPARSAGAPRQVTSGGAGFATSSFTGPMFDAVSRPTPVSEASRRDQEAAARAGTDPTDRKAEAAAQLEAARAALAADKKKAT